MTLYQFYRSDDWEALLVVLKNERVNEGGFLICERCGKPIIKAYDCIGHHKIELTEENCIDANISLNPDNIAFVHHRCHNLIHNKLSYSGRQVFLVYGSPLSGKSSYVQGVMSEGDLVVDIDSIWQCVSGCERYVKPDRLRSVVFQMRDALLDSVAYRRGKWNNAYVIGGYPFQAERNRLADRLGAREVFIDTPKEECVNRLLACEDRPQKEWLGHIEKWWAQYSGRF